MTEKWYTNAIFYSLDIETFHDSNGDGIGDIKGLISKLEYIAGLGATCIWLLPFYPSPNRDNGYDVMDYFNVDSRLGTLGDFASLLTKAEHLGLRIIIDLVVNHTSLKHPWFLEARKSESSPYRDYYVWADEPKPFDRKKLMFNGDENTIWSYDRKAAKYYLHRFYKEQPDLNLSNSRVQREILDIMAYWLRLGVAGFRIDAAEMLFETYGMKNKKNLQGFISKMHDHAVSCRKDALLLAEVNGKPPKMKNFMLNGNRMHMLFNFYLNQHLFQSLASKNKLSLQRAMRSLPQLQESEQFLNFLRHHDELNLGLLSKKDKQVVHSQFAPNKNMLIFNDGIRRRLATMINNTSREKLAWSLLFTMPGVPMIRYGDEIGMGDNLALPGRQSVRTPMQWSSLPNAGFSNAAAKKLVHPVINEGAHGFKKVNVADAQQSPDSLLNWIERLISTRKQCPGIGAGKLFIHDYGNREIFIHGFTSDESKLLFVHNLSARPFEISMKKLGKETFMNIFSSAENENSIIKLEPFGFRWFQANNY